MVRRFWEQEELLRNSSPLTEGEQACEDLFVKTHARTAAGRYVVRLPIVSPLPDLSATRRGALRALTHTERRFQREEKLKVAYAEFMAQYVETGHMTRALPLSEAALRRACYLPHHGVWKESSTTTRLRVVFNGSFSIATGDSLNKHLLPGANLLPALADILLRWRQHRVALTSDIEKMFRQILVHPDDRDLQRIIWRGAEGEAAHEYRLNTVTYGLACAPFLAIRSLLQLATDEEGSFPRGAEVLKSDVYMDDILTGADDEESAIRIRDELRGLCRAGGFPLRKWASNEAGVLTGIPAEECLLGESRTWHPLDSHSTLGLQWHPHGDLFAFKVRAVEDVPITKRIILSETARLFDPLGWLAPVVVRAKILVQSAWLLGLDWDDPMPEAEARVWRNFREELPRVNSMKIPRWLGRGTVQELHGFADASERAFAAVVYLRTFGEDDDQATMRLIGAKTKVAPLKQVSLPRLELCAATLLAQLAQHFQSILGLQRVATHL